FQAARIFFATLGMAILARYLGPTGLGRWTMIVAAGTFLHMVLANWLQQDPFVRFGKPEWSRRHQLRKVWGVRLPFLALAVLLGIEILTLTGPYSLHRWFEFSRFDGWLVFGFFLSLLLSLEAQTILQIVGRMHLLAMTPAIVSALMALLYAALWFSPH